MVKLTSPTPINIECTRSITDEQRKFVENYDECIKTFEKDYSVVVGVEKNEIGTLTLAIGKQQQEAVDPTEVVENMEKTMDTLINWINNGIEAIKTEESTENNCEQTQEESTENDEFFFIRKTSTGYKATGNMDPRKVLSALKAAAIFKMIEENEKPE